MTKEQVINNYVDYLISSEYRFVQKNEFTRYAYIYSISNESSSVFYFTGHIIKDLNIFYRNRDFGNLIANRIPGITMGEVRGIMNKWLKDNS